MQNNISPISFQGQVFVSKYERGVENFVEHKINDAQFKLIKTVIDGMAPAGEVTPLSNIKLKFIFDYLNKVFGTKYNFSKLKTDKMVYNSVDNITITDKEAMLMNGIKVDIQV